MDSYLGDIMGTMIEMSSAEAEERVECYKCRWKGKKVNLTRKYVSSHSKSFSFEEDVEGYEYACPDCGTVLMTNYL